MSKFVLTAHSRSHFALPYTWSCRLQVKSLFSYLNDRAVVFVKYCFESHYFIFVNKSHLYSTAFEYCITWSNDILRLGVSAAYISGQHPDTRRRLQEESRFVYFWSLSLLL